MGAGLSHELLIGVSRVRRIRRMGLRWKAAASAYAKFCDEWRVASNESGPGGVASPPQAEGIRLRVRRGERLRRDMQGTGASRREGTGSRQSEWDAGGGSFNFGLVGGEFLLI